MFNHSITFKRLAPMILGVAIILIGGLIAYYAFTADGGASNLKVVAPVGVFIALLGILPLISKGD